MCTGGGPLGRGEVSTSEVHKLGHTTTGHSAET